MPNKLRLLWKCVNLPKLYFISWSFCCYMFPISVGHKRDSCAKCGYKWSSSPFVAHPYCLTCWLTHWYKAVPRSATTPPSPRSIFFCSASWTRCMCFSLSSWAPAVACVPSSFLFSPHFILSSLPNYMSCRLQALASDMNLICLPLQALASDMNSTCLTCSYKCIWSNFCNKSHVNIYLRGSASLIEPGLIHKPSLRSAIIESHYFISGKNTRIHPRWTYLNTLFSWPEGMYLLFDPKIIYVTSVFLKCVFIPWML